MPNLTSEFWEDKHQRANTTWLTGTPLSNLFVFYNLDDADLSQKSVLEIGVGTGTCSPGLSSKSKVFYAADISKTALAKIEKHTHGTFLTSNLKTCPPVDVAICHLVLVHCDDVESLRIINDINLSENGVAHLQFSEIAGEVDPRVQTDLIDDGSHHFRNLDKIKQMIATSNKEIVEIRHPYTPSSYLDYKLNQIWHFITIKNKNGEHI